MGTENVSGKVDWTGSCRTDFNHDGGKVNKKNELKPFQKKQWVIPAEYNAGFVDQMEQVLSAYERPNQADFPLVCMDESPKQIIDYQEFIGSDGKK